MITKTCLFQFVNAFFSLFYIAFIKNSLEIFGRVQDCKPNAEGNSDCFGELYVEHSWC